MKRNAKQLVICILILMLSFLLVGDLHQAQAFINANHNYNIAEGSKEELYQDAIITLLLPYIDKEVEKYYKKPFQVAPYDIEMININRPSEQWGFNIDLKIMPYWGPHNYVGIDQITLKIFPSKVEVIEFKHLKSYDTSSKLH